MSIFGDIVDFGKDALGVAADVVTGGAYSSYKAQRKARKEQKKQQKAQKAAQEQQKKEALEKRKQQINQMRDQIAGGNYSTRKTSEKGIKGKLKDDKENLG